MNGMNLILFFISFLTPVSKLLRFDFNIYSNSSGEKKLFIVSRNAEAVG